MDHPEDPAPPRTDPAPDVADARFVAIVHELARQDPRFVRRVTRPAPGGLGTGDVMIVVGLLATLLLGILPLAVGVQTGAVAPLVVGVAGCVVLPVAAPLAVRTRVRRWRPLAG